MESMRKTLNGKVIEAGRECPRGVLLLDVDRRWEAYLQLHCRAQDMGVLGQDSELHALIDKRLGFFEQGVS